MTQAFLSWKAAVATVLVGLPGVILAADYYYGPYVDDRAATVGESYARGMADVARSAGMRNLANSEAAINMTEAARRQMENYRQWTDTYFGTRAANRAHRAAERGPRPSMETLVRYAQAGKPKPLSPSELDIISGRIAWPLALQTDPFAMERTRLEALFATRAQQGGLGLDGIMQIGRTTEAMLDELKTQVGDLPPDYYLAARRFLESLAYEGQHPAG